MRTLPKNIYPNTGGGFVVRIKRGDVKLTFCTRELARALAVREQFVALHGRVAIRPARSNTGITGISEVTKWWHNRPYDCFQVTTGNPRRPGNMRRFFYRAGERQAALRAAIAHRARVLGLAEAEVADVG